MPCLWMTHEKRHLGCDQDRIGRHVPEVPLGLCHHARDFYGVYPTDGPFLSKAYCGSGRHACVVLCRRSFGECLLGGVNVSWWSIQGGISIQPEGSFITVIRMLARWLNNTDPFCMVSHFSARKRGNGVWIWGVSL